VYQLATILDATVAAGSDLSFSNNGPLSGVTHTAGSNSIVVPSAGVYLVTYNVTMTAGVGSVVAVSVNGTVAPSTSLSAVVATGQVHGSAMLTLTAGDIISLTNYSAIPLTVALAPGVGAQLTVAQLTGPPS
jgi:hypothetical protein